MLKPVACAWKRIVQVGLLCATVGAWVCDCSLHAAGVTLWWDPPDNTNILGYTIYYGQASLRYSNLWWAGDVNAASLSGLEGGKTYYFAVRAMDWEGIESVVSKEVKIAVPATSSALKGSYTGLFSEAGGVRHESSGGLVLTTGARGTYSGRLQMGRERYSFSGRLTTDLRGQNRMARRGGGQLIMDFHLQPGQLLHQVSGTLSAGDWSAILLGDRAVFGGGSQAAPWAGSYTLVIPGAVDETGLPAGDGVATFKVSPGGTVAAKGTLADGTRFSHSARLSLAGFWPFYTVLYSGQGSLWSWLTFADRPGYDLRGRMNWTKPASTSARFYPDGFIYASDAFGSVYQKPAKSATPLLKFGRGAVTFEGGDLGATFTDSFSLGASSKVIPSDSTQLRLVFSSSDGSFQGQAVNPGTGQPLVFNGVVLQKQNAGRGMILGANQTGRVILRAE